MVILKTHIEVLFQLNVSQILTITYEQWALYLTKTTTIFYQYVFHCLLEKWQ